MRVLVKLLLGLALLSSFADAALYFTVKGEFLCDGELRNVKIKVIEHDPNSDDVQEFTAHTFDLGLHDEDHWWKVFDPLELSIHAQFTCGHCLGELYQYIPQNLQYYDPRKSTANPMDFGSVELKDVCKLGTVKSKHSRYGKKQLKYEWLVRKWNTDIRGYFKEIN